MGILLRTKNEIQELNLDLVEIDAFWNTGQERERRIHRIHSYPAKFPAFITSKALEFAERNGLKPKRIADIFCGCGTVAFEAKRNGIDFWGCDINPVATMIARTKSQNYKVDRLETYFNNILSQFDSLKNFFEVYENANERLKYWYSEKQYIELARLKKAIEVSIPSRSMYREFFMCAFSNILKPASRWLTKSIKPQVDPFKDPVNVIFTFKKQVQYMITAYSEINERNKSRTEILNTNFLSPKVVRPKVDMIITSPPYVTSYEYADLHQLSSLWLGYVEDYRELREGSVGSLYHNNILNTSNLNNTGKKIYDDLSVKSKRQAFAVAKYFLDIQEVAKKCVNMLNENGMAIFVIGDTEYKKIRIENSRHLLEALMESGMRELSITKRKISGKILTPYRDDKGKFSVNQNDRKVYSEEFIVIGRK